MPTDEVRERITELIKMWESDSSYPQFRKAVDTAAVLSRIDNVPDDIISKLDRLSEDGHIGPTASDVFAVVRYLRSLSTTESN
jgi:hypothetical protein